MIDSKPNLLEPQSLPLTGCHLIEASAGTGKTFNITRIYLRLLLERKLDVKNILVMTFTRAATEELRGRIAKEIRNALDNWDHFDPKDPFFSELSRQFSRQDIYPALHNALLHLDEAAIFTIHGFCKRVLSQQAFSSGVAFNVQMETDTADIELEAVRDWFRLLAKQTDNCSADHNDTCYKYLIQNWLTPEIFHRAFREVLSSTTPVQTNSSEQIQEAFQNQKNACLKSLQDNQSIVFAELIDTHKQKNIRTQEWHDLIDWLSDQSFAVESQAMPKTAGNVFNGVRYAKKDPVKKQQFIDLFEPVKQLKAAAAGIGAAIEKSQSYQIARQGIEFIRQKIAQAKLRSRVMNYDDLINQLADALSISKDSAGKESGENKLAQLIKNQYPVALVDEFQDTDPNQYAILHAIYHSDHHIDKETALYMIGDPKQAIYAFRSGDVFTYLSARSDADAQWLMDTNWRSSSQMVNACNRLFYGAALDQDAGDVFGFNIQYTPVNSAGQADKTPLIIESNQSALQFIYFPFNEDYRPGRSKKEEMNQSFCPVIARWCSYEIHKLLTENTTIGLSDEQGRDLQEQDIAVLVRDKKEAAYIQDALRQAGYSCVYLSSHDNVFLSEEAIELERVLSGILELENDRLLIAALSSRFLGCDATELFVLQEDEEQWETYRERIFELRETWFKRGFMAMALALLHQNYSPDPQHHERALTNAIQLLELLQQASQRHRQPEQLLNWLREQIETQNISAEAELRLESDANLIRIITQHGAKGLEYPIVFIPYATRYKDPAKFANKKIDLFKYHERDSHQLNYFIGQDKTITDLYREEAWAETIRLLYVAITRAEHRCYVCVTPFTQFHLSPLGQTLKLNSGDDFLLRLKLLSGSEPDSDSEPKDINVQEISDIDFPVTHNALVETIEQPVAAQFTGHIERNWWLSSFSALTRNLRHGGISTPEHDQDEQLHNETIVISTPDDLRFSLTKGAATGNLLHDILEHTDFSQANSSQDHSAREMWQRSMERPLACFNESLDQAQQNELILWLESCLDTGLGSSLLDGPKLNELSWSQTLRETEFYFPMEQVKPYLLGKLLAGHRQQKSAIQLPGNKVLQGMMHGFIDLIFQWQGKFYIVDYKSTHLGNHPDDYQQSALQKNVRDNYYDLQYLLYSLALHRYLKIRQKDYDPNCHFGGVHYLYLRGMMSELSILPTLAIRGETKKQSVNGVFSTHISPELLNELDALFLNVMHGESHNV